MAVSLPVQATDPLPPRLEHNAKSIPRRRKASRAQEDAGRNAGAESAGRAKIYPLRINGLFRTFLQVFVFASLSLSFGPTTPSHAASPRFRCAKNRCKYGFPVGRVVPRSLLSRSLRQRFMACVILFLVHPDTGEIVMKRILLATLLALAATSALAAPTLQGSNDFAVSRDRRLVLAQLYCVVGGGLCWNFDTRVARRRPSPANRPLQGRATGRVCPNGWICRYR
jgi:hypothetical protein